MATLQTRMSTGIKDPGLLEIHATRSFERVKYRISVLGFTGVGKSSLIQRLLNPDDIDFVKAGLPESGLDDMYTMVLQRGGKTNPKLDTESFGDELTAAGVGFEEEEKKRSAKKRTLTGSLRLNSVSADSTVVLDIYDSGVGTLDTTHEHVAAHSVICVYDLGDKTSFDYLQQFPSGFLRAFKGLRKDDIPYAYKTFVLVGNKADSLLENMDAFGFGEDERESKVERPVFRETADLFCEEYGWLYFEVSALTGYNCQALFDDIIQHIDVKMAEGIEDDPAHEKTTVCDSCVLL